ncbi:hypothetical protein PoB_005497200, partial [Plakobranchus ocellatus]
MWKFSPLVTYSLFLAGLSASFLASNSVEASSKSCTQLTACENILEGKIQRIINDDALTMPYYAMEILNQFCGAASRMINCHVVHMEDCNSSIGKERALIDKLILYRICFLRDRQLLRHLWQTQCAENYNLQGKLQIEFDKCLANFTATVDAMLPAAPRIDLKDYQKNRYMYLLRVCFVNRTKQLCGDEMGNFIRDIWYTGDILPRELALLGRRK